MLRVVHGVIFSHPGPVLTIVQVEQLPYGVEVSVELEAIAGSGESATKFESDIDSSSSSAVLVGGGLWTSALRGDPSRAQVAQTVEDANGLMKHAGVGPCDVVSTRHFMCHDVQFEASPPEWLEFKNPSIPTSAGIAVSGVSEQGHTVAFEMVGVTDADVGRTNLRTGRTFEVDHTIAERFWLMAVMGMRRSQSRWAGGVTATK